MNCCDRPEPKGRFWCGSCGRDWCAWCLEDRCPHAGPVVPRDLLNKIEARQRCCRNHTEPGEARYTCATAPGATDPCCNRCHYWISFYYEDEEK